MFCKNNKKNRRRKCLSIFLKNKNLFFVGKKDKTERLRRINRKMFFMNGA